MGAAGGTFAVLGRNRFHRTGKQGAGWPGPIADSVHVGEVTGLSKRFGLAVNSYI